MITNITRVCFIIWSACYTLYLYSLMSNNSTVSSSWSAQLNYTREGCDSQSSCYCVCVCACFSDAPVSELSLELLLLQVVLPALLEQGHTRQWLKGLVRAWTVTAGYLL